MKENVVLNGQQVPVASIARQMLLGAIIGLILIGLFLLSAGEPNPEWPRFWRIRPLIIVPLGGAMGGAFYAFLSGMRAQRGWVKIVAYMIGLIGFLIALWMGTVLGLDGTYWN